LAARALRREEAITPGCGALGRRLRALARELAEESMARI
jgi:hypothetical protein